MDQMSPSNASAQPELLMGWQATSIPVHERSKRWYMIGGGLLLVGVAYGILSGAWSFSIVLVLCGAMYFLLRNHVPEAKAIGFTREGVLFNQTFTRYEDISGFWIIETPAYNELHLAQKSRRKPEIVIQTADVSPLDIRTVLGQFLAEQKDKRERLIDIIIRLCKL